MIAAMLRGWLRDRLVSHRLFFPLMLLAGTPSLADRAPQLSPADTAYTRLRPLLEKHCLMCHSAKPAIPAYPGPPAGVVLETREQLQRFAPRISALTAQAATMPPANLTGMTPAERDLLGRLMIELVNTTVCQPYSSGNGASFPGECDRGLAPTECPG